MTDQWINNCENALNYYFFLQILENSFNPPPTKRKLLAIPGEKGIFESEDWKDETTMFSHIKYDTLVNTKNIEQFSFRYEFFFMFM